MKIRKAKIQEIDKIRKLNTAIFMSNSAYDDDIIPQFADTEIGKKYFEKAIKRTDGCFFVAEENKQLIGYTNGGALDLAYRKSKYFEIENLGVLPGAKRKGVGTQLIEAIQTWAKEHGYQKIYLESYIRNKEALAFYRKQGYIDIDISLEKTL